MAGTTSDGWVTLSDTALPSKDEEKPRGGEKGKHSGQRQTPRGALPNARKSAMCSCD